jgi:hypothetical protein
MASTWTQAPLRKAEDAMPGRFSPEIQAGYRSPQEQQRTALTTPRSRDGYGKRTSVTRCSTRHVPPDAVQSANVNNVESSEYRLLLKSAQGLKNTDVIAREILLRKVISDVNISSGFCVGLGSADRTDVICTTSARVTGVLGRQFQRRLSG